MIETRFSSYRMLLGMLFITSLLAGGVFAIKLVTIVGIILPASIFVYPFTYVLLTAILEVYGKGTATRMVWISMVCCLVALAAAAMVDGTPGATIAPHAVYFHQWHLDTSRLLSFSAGGFLIGYFVGMFVIHRDGAEYSLFTRVFLFPLIGQTISGTVIIVGGFYTEPLGTLVALTINRTIFAAVYAAASAPLIYLLVEWVRQREMRDALHWVQQNRSGRDLRP